MYPEIAYASTTANKTAHKSRNIEITEEISSTKLISLHNI
jgi:hypothetical protein